MAALGLLAFEAPRSLAALLALVSERHARRARTVLLAGGTDWYVEQHASPPPPEGTEGPLVVDVSRLEALRGIAASGGRLRLGGGTTFLELRRSPLVKETIPLLGSMAGDVGALQIQARGTLAGNLVTGSPAADGVAALAALDAVVELSSIAGSRRVPLSGFYTGYRAPVRRPDEVVTAIEVPIPSSSCRWMWRKVGTRRAQAISKVALAALAEVEDGRITRIGLGMASVAPTVSFLPSVRALALGRAPAELDDRALDGATLADISPIDDVRSTAAYRRHVACALVRRFFGELAG